MLRCITHVFFSFVETVSQINYCFVVLKIFLEFNFFVILFSNVLQMNGSIAFYITEDGISSESLWTPKIIK